MRILFFPTRFFPAISGGDFYMQRIAESFKKNLKESNNNPHQVQIISSNAIDFAGIRGAPNGKFVTVQHKNYSKYNQLDVKRLDVRNRINNDQKDGKSKNFIKIKEEHIEKISNFINIKPSTLDYFFEMGPLLKDFFSFVEKLQKSKSKAPEVIHCTYLPYANLAYSLFLSKKLHIPSIVTPFLHQENIRYQTHEIFALLNRFSKVIACTDYEKNILINKGIDKGKIHVLPMGVDFDKFQKEKAKKTKSIYNIRKPLILFCGNKNFEKGAITILKSMPYTAKKYKNLTYVFIGPPTSAFNYCLKNVRNKVDKIRILNLTPDNLRGIFDYKKIGLFQLADIYCMPSRSEAYGIAYLEAWATKTPVIACNLDAIKEVVHKDRDGLLVDFNNEHELSKSIIRLLNNPRLRTKLGKNGWNKVKKFNSWEDIARNTYQIYQFAINEGVYK